MCFCVKQKTAYVFFFKQKTAYEIMPSLVGSEMCIRDRKYFPHLKVGTLVSAINMVIVLASGVVYRNIDSILYAIVTVYAVSYTHLTLPTIYSV